MTDRQFGIHREITSGGLVAILSGQFTESDFDLFEEEIFEVLEECPRHLLLDLTGLTYISSSGLGMIVQLRNHLKENNFRVLLLKPRSEAVCEVLRTTKIETLFEVFPGAPEARAVMDGA